AAGGTLRSAADRGVVRPELCFPEHALLECRRRGSGPLLPPGRAAAAHPGGGRGSVSRLRGRPLPLRSGGGRGELRTSLWTLPRRSRRLVGVAAWATMTDRKESDHVPERRAVTTGTTGPDRGDTAERHRGFGRSLGRQPLAKDQQALY